MINKKYQILYVDPPWKYGGTGGTKWLPASEYYQTMSFNELKKLQINKICEKDCLLFLWVVSSKLKECIEVGESWGFKYITVAFAWHKNRANVGNYTMSSVELHDH
jgi:site-specific DNA-methyltransferase (adenine-specific)